MSRVKLGVYNTTHCVQVQNRNNSCLLIESILNPIYTYTCDTTGGTSETRRKDLQRPGGRIEGTLLSRAF